MVLKVSIPNTTIDRIINKNCMDVDPSIILTLDETDYMLNSVVSHYGRTTHEGHYITTLYRDGQWIEIDDHSVVTKHDDPLQGYMFFYDRVETQMIQHGVSFDSPQSSSQEEHVKSKECLNDGEYSSLKEKNSSKREEIEDSDTEENIQKMSKKNEVHGSVHTVKDNNLYSKLNKDTSSTSKKLGSSNHLEKIDGEKNLIICKNCSKNVKNLPLHLSKTKETLGCMIAYSDDEISALAQASDKRTRAR